MIIPLLDLFTTAKETDSNDAMNLTEENIYSHSHYFLNEKYDRVPVLSASTVNEGIIGYVPDLRNSKQKKEQKTGEPINAQGINYYKNKEEGCITIVADGVYAGYTFFRAQNEYPLFCGNTSCLILMKKGDDEIKKDYQKFDGLNVEWFDFRFHNMLKNILRGEGVKHFTQTICKSIEELEIPPIKEQEIELIELRKMNDINKHFDKIKNNTEKLLDKEVNGFEAVVEDDFGNIFLINKGTGGFTEEGIYHDMPLNNHPFIPFFGGEKIHRFPEKFVRDGAKNNKGKVVKYFSGECLILSMDGSAGYMTYKPNGEKFTLNHHAASITLKPQYNKKINLKWFKHEYQKTLIDSTVSKKSSRTLSKEVLESIFITAPKPTEQEAWVKEIEEIEQLNNRLEKIKNHITLLTEKEIIV